MHKPGGEWKVIHTAVEEAEAEADGWTRLPPSATPPPEAEPLEPTSKRKGKNGKADAE